MRFNGMPVFSRATKQCLSTVNTSLLEGGMNGRIFARLLTVAFPIAACDQARPIPTEFVTRHPDVREYVSGDAAARLDREGRFILPEPRAPDDIPIITPSRARELAAAFLRTWGEPLLIPWERQRGGAIDLGNLRLSPDVYFAETPHARFPDGFHGAYRRMFGPWYILHFTSGGEPVLGVAVSAYSTDLEVRNGTIHQPVEGGSYFTAWAVAAAPTAGFAYHPVSPEAAVAQVSARTGAKVTDVPALTLRNAGWLQLLAHWRVTLDRPVQVVRTHAPGSSAPGEAAAVRDLYVAPGGKLFVAARQQPAASRIWASRHAAGLKDGRAVEVPRRGEMPTEFDEVELTGE
jgi:hypothetical protein